MKQQENQCETHIETTKSTDDPPVVNDGGDLFAGATEVVSAACHHDGSVNFERPISE
jgi:hypothetical protein